MKQTRTTLVVFAIVAGMAFGAKAQEKAVKLEPIGKDTYQLTYFKKCPCSVSIEVTDQKGNILHTESIQQKKAFTKPYSFKELDLGEFDFKVTDDEGSYTTKIKRTDEVNVLASIRKLDEEKAKVIVKGDFMSPVFVTIYDKYDVVVFEDYINHERSFSRVYDLSKVRADELRIKVGTENKVLASAEF